MADVGGAGKIDYQPINKPSLYCTSLSTVSDAVSINDTLRTLQSRFFTWSDRTTPSICFPFTVTSKGYPLILLVMGQAIISLVFSLYSLGDSTRAGRFPACSCPAWGLKLIQTKSPLSGMNSVFTKSLLPQECSNRFRNGDSFLRFC